MKIGGRPPSSSNSKIENRARPPFPVWGAKIELKQEVKGGKERTLHFFLDGIPESSLFEAVSSIQNRVNDFTQILGEDYLEQIKHLGFSYEDGAWKMIGVEKFNGDAELPTTN